MLLDLEQGRGLVLQARLHELGHLTINIYELLFASTKAEVNRWAAKFATKELRRWACTLVAHLQNRCVEVKIRVRCQLLVARLDLGRDKFDDVCNLCICESRHLLTELFMAEVAEDSEEFR